MSENHDSTPVLDEYCRRFLQAVKDSGRPELHQLSVEAARAQFAKGQAIIPVTMPPADVKSLDIPAAANPALTIHIVRPAGSQGVLPAVMYFHGGGWVVGDFSTHERAAREIAVGSPAAVIFVDYTRSPEARFPVANEEAYAATQWVAANGPSIGIDPARIAVAGDSAGGNMAAMVAIMAKARGGPKLCAQVMFYPSTGGSPDLPSRRQFATDYFLTAETSMWFWKHYIGDASRETQAAAWPLLRSGEDLAGLPPALIITAECDLLRDEGEAYARKLSQAGVRVTATRCLGTLHGFTVANAMAESGAARNSLAQACAMLRQAFDAVIV